MVQEEQIFNRHTGKQNDYDDKLGSRWGENEFKKLKMNTNGFLSIAIRIKVILNAILLKNKSKIILLIVYRNFIP